MKKLLFIFSFFLFSFKSNDPIENAFKTMAFYGEKWEDMSGSVSIGIEISVEDLSDIDWKLFKSYKLVPFYSKANTIFIVPERFAHKYGGYYVVGSITYHSDVNMKTTYIKSYPQYPDKE